MGIFALPTQHEGMVTCTRTRQPHAKGSREEGVKTELLPEPGAPPPKKTTISSKEKTEAHFVLHTSDVECSL